MKNKGSDHTSLCSANLFLLVTITLTEIPWLDKPLQCPHLHTQMVSVRPFLYDSREGPVPGT